MPFVANIPQPTDFLSDSQEDLRQNNLQLDASFGIDHYTFSNATANNGKHNQVTTPLIIGAVHPTTSATDMKFYAMQDIAAIGLLQYSRGWDTVGSISGDPSPVTSMQSPVAGLTILNGGGLGSNTPLLDFTGLSFAEGDVIAYSADVTKGNRFFKVASFLWVDAALPADRSLLIGETVSEGGQAARWSFVGTGNVLELRGSNTSPASTSNVYWTIAFKRIRV
jgi:hypothetical protein